MFLLDLGSGQVVRDAEVKAAVCARKPYGAWLAERALDLPGHGLSGGTKAAMASTPGSARLDAYFGMEESALRVLEPMLATGKEAVTAMGTRKAPAVLSGQPRHLFDYFKQLFAQVIADRVCGAGTQPARRVAVALRPVAPGSPLAAEYRPGKAQGPAP